MPDEKSNDNSIIENVVENSFENNKLSKISNILSLCTNLFTSTEKYYQNQKNFYQVDVRAEDLIAIKKQQRSYYSTVDKKRLNNMFSNLRSLTLS